MVLSRPVQGYLSHLDVTSRESLGHFWRQKISICNDGCRIGALWIKDRLYTLCKPLNSIDLQQRLSTIPTDLKLAQPPVNAPLRMRQAGLQPPESLSFCVVLFHNSMGNRSCTPMSGLSSSLESDWKIEQDGPSPSFPLFRHDHLLTAFLLEATLRAIHLAHIRFPIPCGTYFLHVVYPTKGLRQSLNSSPAFFRCGFQSSCIETASYDYPSQTIKEISTVIGRR